MINKYQNIKIHFFLLIITVSSAYSVKFIIYDGKFEDLSEERKQKIHTIIEEFDGEIEAICLRKKNNRMVNIYFKEFYELLKESMKNFKSKKKHRETFIKSIKAIKTDKTPLSIDNTIRVLEKNGIKLLEKAGYPKTSNFSLKIDTGQGDFRYLVRTGELGSGVLKFNECYNGIPIISKGVEIRLGADKIVWISIYTLADEDINIIGYEPKITSRDALDKYLSSSKKIVIESMTNKLCYIQSFNNSLELCWEFYVYTVSVDSKRVYINALTGETLAEDSLVEY